MQLLCNWNRAHDKDIILRPGNPETVSHGICEACVEVIRKERG